MFVRRFEVKNFMVHRDTRMDLFPITVLVGANNGGKSALFDAILNFSMVSRGRLSQAFGPGPFSYHYLKHHGTSPTARISYRVSFSESADSAETLDYRISYGQQGVDYIIFDESVRSDTGATIFDRSDPDSYPMGASIEFLSNDRSIFAAIRQAQVAGKYDESHPLMTAIARDVSRISKYRLDPSNLARPSRLPDTPTDELMRPLSPRISYRGEDLATVLYYLAETQSPSLDRIVLSCQEAIDGFQEFEFNIVGTDRVGFSVRFSDSRGTVPAANLSDGTVVCIGLMALLLGPDRAPIVCLEEPENGLTPPVTRSIYKTMKEFVDGTATGERGQLLVSSHSPYVICEAWNGNERNFIYQMRPVDGAALVRSFVEILEHHQIHLEKDQTGARTRLNLRNAELILEGYLSE
jgi:hypothetical protein